MNIGLKINLKLLLDIWSLQEAKKIKITVLGNLIPLAKIMNIGLIINLKLLFDIWSHQEAKNIKLRFRVI